MSSNLDVGDRTNDPYAIIDQLADLLIQHAHTALEANETDRISREAVIKIMTAAVKLYSAQAHDQRDPYRPLAGRYDEEVTGTEVLTAAIEILRAVGLGPTELALWCHRKPRNYAYTPHEDALDVSRAKPPTGEC